MRVFFRFAAIAMLTCLAGMVLLQAETTGGFYNEGKKAEARGDYDKAYLAYEQAFNRKPTDLKLRAAYLRMKGLASEVHVKNGQKLREQGKLAEAIVEFQRAEEIDPSNFLADQEVRRTQDQLSGTPHQIKQQKADSPIQRRLDEAQGPVDLMPINNDSINMRMSADSKTIYTSIGKIAGLNVIFDPDFQSKPLQVDLNKVSLNDALYIVGTLSNTFWKPVTPNTIFVAQNSQQKRKELEDNVVKTFYLSNLSQPTEIQDVVNALRNILELRYVFPINSEQTIVVRGSPDQLAIAQKIIEDMDKAKPEVVIDVKVLSVSREKVRDLGISPPTSVTAQLQSLTSTNNNSSSSSSSSSSSNGTNGTSTTPSTNGLTLNDLGNLNAQNFAISIPAATANLNFSDSDTKLLQNPQVRASDGEKATLKIGSRIPIATGSFGSPAGTTAGLGLVANTQFQYIDVGVNVDITPKVHGDEVSMKIALDISSQSGQATIGGVTQPIIAQNKVEHTVRVKEGEVTILGGFMEQQDLKSLGGLPFLSQVPLLKYLFSSTHTDKIDTQIIFVLTPRVVRDLNLSDRNLESIDIGTQNGVELRRISKQQPEATPTPQVVQNNNQPVQPVQPVQQPTPVPTPAVTQPDQTPQQQSTFKFDPPTTTVSAGSTFSVNVNILNGQDVSMVPLEITYNPNVVSITDVNSGDLLKQDGQPVAIQHRDDGAGTLYISISRPPNVAGISGSGTVATINLQAKTKGQSVLAIAKQGSKNSQQQPLAIMGAMTMVSVQ